MPQGPRQCRKKCAAFLRRGGGSLEERPYDASRGQNRYDAFLNICEKTCQLLSVKKTCSYRSQAGSIGQKPS